MSEELIQELLKKYPPLLTQQHVKEITGLADSTIEQARLKGGFLPFVRIGRNVRYPLDGLVSYLERLPRYNSTTQADQDKGVQ
jgi:hypothetical protein